ncbi:MAG: metallopeptidase TldD-related protein, partial [Candidatus Methanofastidiosia archaeon]
RVSRRVLLQLEGVRAKAGSYPCVLGPRVVGILAHEALGHLAEADLTLNSAFAGKIGEKVASEGVYMVDNPKEEFFGTSKYDDEGVKMRKVEIISDGVLKGLLTNREYAQKTSLKAIGASRAEDWRVPPLIRMRSTYFEKGDYSLDELFERIDFGYYCVDFRGGQAELSSSFQIGVQEVFEISKGEISKPVKDLSISGIATEALKLIEGVSSEMDFEQGRCGKGQEAFVTSGGPHLMVKKGGIIFGGR